jgi:putative phage-type endonuclease
VLERIALKDLTREEWLSLRRGGVGGSDAAAILGVSPYATAADVWLDKMGLAAEREPSERMIRGVLIESAAAKRFCQLAHLRVRNPRELLLSERYGYPMVANLDRVVFERGEPGVLELKDIGDFGARHWEEGVPAYYLAQVDHYLAVTGYRFAHVAGWVGGAFLWPRLERNEERIAALIEAERTFWREHIETGCPPEPDDSEGYANLLHALYPTSEGDEVELPDSAAALCERRAAAKAAIAIQERTVRDCENRLKALLEEHEVGRLGEWTVTWRSVERAAYAVPAKTYRQLRVKGPKADE